MKTRSVAHLALSDLLGFFFDFYHRVLVPTMWVVFEWRSFDSARMWHACHLHDLVVYHLRYSSRGATTLP